MATTISTWVNSMRDADGGFARRRRQFALLPAVVMLSGIIINQASCSCAAEPELPAPRFLLAWGKEGSEPGEFYFPIGIAINVADEILITDHYNNRVQKFDSEGNLLGRFAVLPNPGGIALDKAGNIYLSHFPTSVLNKDISPDRITVYSATGTLLHEWGKTGSALVSSVIQAGRPLRQTVACISPIKPITACKCSIPADVSWPHGANTEPSPASLAAITT